MPVFISSYIRRRDEAAKKVPEREVSAALTRQHIENYDQTSLAFPVLTSPDLSTFGDERGVIVYGRKMGYVFALADPLAPEDASGDLLDEFIEAFGDPVFTATSRATAERLASRGYLVNAFGHDTIIDLESYNFGGGGKKRVRYSESWLKRIGAFVTETPDRAIDPREVRSISEAWRDTRVAEREIAFLNRPLSFAPPAGVRRFFALGEDGSVLGFNDFDPIHENGRCIGYLASVKRRVPANTTYLDLAIVAHAIRKFQSEGLAQVRLGISPLALEGIPDVGQPSRWVQGAFRYMFGADWVNKRLFSFQGLVEAKGRFKGQPQPLYICLPRRGSNFMRMAGFLILTKIV